MNRLILFYLSIFLILTFNQGKCQTSSTSQDETRIADKLLQISEQGHENFGNRNVRGIGGFGGLGAGGGLYGGGFGGGIYGGGLKYRQKIVIKKRGFVGGVGGFKGGFGGGIGGIGGGVGGLGLGGGLGHGGLGYGGLGHGGLGHGGFFR